MPYLLVLAKLDAEHKRSFSAIAAVTKLDLAVSEKVEASLTWLESHEPRVVVFDTAVVQAEKLCQKVRSKKQLATVPLIALVSDTSDAFVERLYSFGADDVIRSDDGAQLVSRLKALPSTELLTKIDRGMAVVADKDHGRCDVFGRVLMNAGYDVKFALDDVALRYYTQQSRPALVVASAELGPPRSLIEEARRRGCNAVWIVTSARRDLGKHAEDLLGLERVTVVATSAAPESLLFTSNELLRGEGPPSRAGERVLYGTVVAYRPAGGDIDDVGFSYNVSAGGVYIRTLAPPEPDQVWIDLRPPRCKQRVRLEGRVAWRRFYDPGSAANVPPGFGISFTAGLANGLELWQKHTASFVASLRTGPGAVAAMLAESLRASSPELDPASDSHIAAVQVTVQTPIVTAAAAAAAVAPAVAPARKAIESVPTLDAEALEDRASNPLATVLPPSSERGPRPVASAALPTPEPVAPEPAAPAARKSRVVPLALSFIILVGAAVTAAVFLEVGPFAKQKARAPAVPIVPPVAVAPRVDAATPSPAVSAAGPDAAAAPPLASDAAIDAPSDAASAGLPPLDESGGDGHDLAANLGLLAVRSSAAVDVYATGFKIGPTNKKNTVACGLKFVKLGKSEPPLWLTPGQTVDVKCRALTVIELEPK